MPQYIVLYRPSRNSPVKVLRDVEASNKHDAWLTVIHRRFNGKTPASAWVYGRKLSNGITQYFNTDERHPY